MISAAEAPLTHQHFQSQLKKRRNGMGGGGCRVWGKRRRGAEKERGKERKKEYIHFSGWSSAGGLWFQACCEGVKSKACWDIDRLEFLSDAHPGCHRVCLCVHWWSRRSPPRPSDPHTANIIPLKLTPANKHTGLQLLQLPRAMPSNILQSMCRGQTQTHTYYIYIYIYTQRLGCEKRNIHTQASFCYTL